MYAYKFRLFFDEVEDFVRDFELLADHTFYDFHEIIVQNIAGLDGFELASFYICDNKWNKLKEITLMDMEDNEEEKDDQRMPKMTMEESILSNLIDDPHQRLIYEYDFLNIKTFFIELLRSSVANAKFTYPRCTASAGELPKQTVLVPKDEFDFSDLTDDDFDDADEDSGDFYDEEDLKKLSNDIEF